MNDWPCVSIAEAARMLGLKPWPVYRLAETGALPALRIGGRVMIRRADVEQYAAGCAAGVGLRTLRTAQGLTLRQLAAMSRTSATYLSQVERGQRTPTREWMRTVLEALAGNLIRRGPA